MGGFYTIEAADYDEAVRAFSHSSATWNTAAPCEVPPGLGDVDNSGTETGPLLDLISSGVRRGASWRTSPGSWAPPISNWPKRRCREAMLRALQGWPSQGVPENPADMVVSRRAQVFGRLMPSAPQSHSAGEDRCDGGGAHPLSSLRCWTIPRWKSSLPRRRACAWIFLCCHPEIPREAGVALSLKTVGGFSVREIASAFLADDAAIAQRLVRTKKQIRETGLTLDAPSPFGYGSAAGCGPGGDLFHLQRRLHGS